MRDRKVISDDRVGLPFPGKHKIRTLKIKAPAPLSSATAGAPIVSAAPTPANSTGGGDGSPVEPMAASSVMAMQDVRESMASVALTDDDSRSHHSFAHVTGGSDREYGQYDHGDYEGNEDGAQPECEATEYEYDFSAEVKSSALNCFLPITACPLLCPNILPSSLSSLRHPSRMPRRWRTSVAQSCARGWRPCSGPTPTFSRSPTTSRSSPGKLLCEGGACTDQSSPDCLCVPVQARLCVPAWSKGITVPPPTSTHAQGFTCPLWLPRCFAAWVPATRSARA